jgi:hypothetical protein
MKKKIDLFEVLYSYCMHCHIAINLKFARVSRSAVSYSYFNLHFAENSTPRILHLSFCCQGKSRHVFSKDKSPWAFLAESKFSKIYCVKKLRGFVSNSRKRISDGHQTKKSICCCACPIFLSCFRKRISGKEISI